MPQFLDWTTANGVIGTEKGSPYIVSELLESETLRAKLVAGQLPLRNAVDYAMQIARGLAAAHNKGIVHRDLKPENVFITRDGQVKILDFGLAKLTGEAAGNDATRTVASDANSVVGTVGYMSPEQARGKATRLALPSKTQSHSARCQLEVPPLPHGS